MPSCPSLRLDRGLHLFEHLTLASPTANIFAIATSVDIEQVSSRLEDACANAAHIC